MSSWERNGGGDICVTLCLQQGDAGGHEKIFRKAAIFWRFAPLLPKRQKIPTFRKMFSCPPPPLQTQGYTNVPLPPLRAQEETKLLVCALRLVFLWTYRSERRLHYRYLFVFETVLSSYTPSFFKVDLFCDDMFSVLRFLR